MHQRMYSESIPLGQVLRKKSAGRKNFCSYVSPARPRLFHDRTIGIITGIPDDVSG